MTEYRFPFPLDTITVVWNQVDKEHPNGHRGTDFAPDGGGTILAVSNGTVVRVEKQIGLGWVLSVRDDDGVFWHLSHLAARPPVNVGDRVTIGVTPVGEVGSTGTLTTGRHLHFTMSFDSDDPGEGSTFDAIPYIASRLSKPRSRRNTVTTNYVKITSSADKQGGQGSLWATAGDLGTPCPGNWDEFTRTVYNNTDPLDRGARAAAIHGVPILLTDKEWEAEKARYTTPVPVGTVTTKPDPALLAAVEANTAVLKDLLTATKKLNPPD